MSLKSNLLYKLRIVLTIVLLIIKLKFIKTRLPLFKMLTLLYIIKGILLITLLLKII